MNETQFARRVAQTLDGGLRQFDPTTASRLSAMRHQALARQKRVTVQASRLAGLAGVFNDNKAQLAPWLAALVLLLVLATGFYWQAQNSLSDLEDVDSALLADDLPVSAYLDKGFDAWLHGSSSEQ
ncbi:hypothetical protein OTERR_07670 [Oryzomicrobium terrae]|jgi:hypothetical protein|uniref:Transmembrane protein n=1 Tax=Oryzomicrobium terrae TaxID=1735038 RepID=A0A5C1E5V1_9RHOO|nr:DUF3619 family protein [Oryzomicrobium terrae]QEL64243.1 hypothetical protein OTERR_07670 [Oryzomicrobium terrae]